MKWHNAAELLRHCAGQVACLIAALLGAVLGGSSAGAADESARASDAPNAHDTRGLEAANRNPPAENAASAVVEAHSPIAADPAPKPAAGAASATSGPIADFVPAPQPVPVGAAGLALNSLSVAAAVAVSWLALFAATLMILRPR